MVGFQMAARVFGAVGTFKDPLGQEASPGREEASFPEVHMLGLRYQHTHRWLI